MSDIKNIEQHYSLDERPFLEKVRGFCQLVDDRYSPYLTDFLNPREIQIVDHAHVAMNGLVGGRETIDFQHSYRPLFFVR